MHDLHFCNVILKARQLGFTTFIQIFMLDQCLFNSNIRAGTIAHRLDDARTIFRNKMQYPYDNLAGGSSQRSTQAIGFRRGASAVEQFLHQSWHVATFRHVAVSADL